MIFLMKTIIDIFNQIRKVPYKIVDVEYSLGNCYDLIKNNGASCTPKHIVLADKFKSLGLKTRFCVHEFKWTDFKVSFPDKISELMKVLPSDFHTNLEVKVDNKWIRVDATWDDELIEAGFPGTKNWNGKESTLNCVFPLHKYKFHSIMERDEFVKVKKEKNRLNPQVESEFISELNDFFDRIRKK
jgi:hypothetical protein